MADLCAPVAGVELILGGQKSGKSRRAELLAQAWLAGGDAAVPRQATLIATAQPWDAEMHQRIARHRADRALRVPGLATVEEPLALARTLRHLSAPHHLLVVDCLTLWLTNLLMPADAAVASAEDAEQNRPFALVSKAPTAQLLEALRCAPGPVVLVGNEIGLGVIPLGREVRQFVDALGLLNQGVAEMAQRVVLMVAGQALPIKQ
jgi:adenosylcobinamide kinase/adenosylcobinamide-phosphate guanylyltransferase